MKNQLILARGAEAVIELKDNLIIKDRISKSYRIKELDDKIRKQRTKAEKKLLEKASKIINAPKPLNEEQLREYKLIPHREGGRDERAKLQERIIMPFIEGEKLSEHLDSFPLEKQKEICKIIGQEIAKLHDADIIHGDLTTSNMILVDKSKVKKENIPIIEPCDKDLSGLTKSQRSALTKSGAKQSIASDSEPIIFFIDFGLGYISRKIEDKAVDLHLLKQAMEAKHFKNWEILFREVIEGYKNYKESQKVLERLKAVEKRGRYKEH
ncbi:MAG: lipopolysaccharide kinase InaA family protein [Candidatus Nanoarchaeia archaeon]|nr:lipopolysaccharide kinase InaA family protein [Candidatus Nanoarchaeia archaeon]MDD5358473.1 lipopolysaccharide kinase InaA family protein [Candidatus Nanoarchaeia archaeon]MDD5588987.1 lipopolysaccharide kinase InaA family protein [Candidatus Nanoarchaeia archaeon]